MARSLQQLLRPLVPNFGVRIRHIEKESTLKVRFREHLGLIARGTKAFEPRYVQVLKCLINQGDTVFDIGANIGFYTVLFSSWSGLAGRVVAYEPDPSNLGLLQRNLELNGCENVIVRPLALSSRSGRALFSIDSVTRSTGHLGAGATFGETQFGSGKEELITVNTTTLDQEIDRLGVPQLIKMDIEGGEFDTLSGGSSLLHHHRPLIVSELNAWSAEPAGNTRAQQATQFLSALQYSLWDLDTGSRLDAGAAAWMVFACPKEKEGIPRVCEVLAGLRPGRSGN